MTTSDGQPLSVLERVDLALATRMVAVAADEPLAGAQRILDGVRRPAPGDAAFLASLLRLRGFVIDDDAVAEVLAGRNGRLSPVAQEHRLMRGLLACLCAIRVRAADGQPPDGWFLVDLFRAMTMELPRFRNNELRRGPPWDAVMWADHPAPEQLRSILDSFDEPHCYRDLAPLWNSLHPVRQGFRLMWRFARIAPFPDFNLVIAWLGMNAWLQAKGFPLLPPEVGDQHMLARLISGPPPTKLVPLETRLLTTLGEVA
ncbi:MAG: hypothetical protein WAT39_14885 [Planctomycetota bacterium]